MTEQDVKDQIARAWPNIRKMLICRGYDETVMAENFTIDALNSILRNGGTLIIPPKPPSLREIKDIHNEIQNKAIPTPKMVQDKSVVLLFTLEDKVGVKSVRSLLEWMDKKEVHQGIIFSVDGATPFSIKFVKNSTMHKKVKLEFKSYKRYSICLIAHMLVPYHRILNENEKRRLLVALHLTEDQLPKHQATDAVVQYYGLSPGVVVEYYRCNGIQEISCNWRVTQ